MPANHRRRHVLLSLALLPLLPACVPIIVATGTAATLISAHDRRTTGTQADDETSEWKGSNRLPAEYRENAHVNFTAFNRRLLVSGEVPSDDARQAIGAMANKIEGVRQVHNELLVMPAASLASRSNDALISSRFRARLLDNDQVSANHIKALTENGTLFLMGLVSEHEALAAVLVARTTAGVRKVVNLLEIMPESDIRQLDNRLLGSRTPPAPTRVPVDNR